MARLSQSDLENLNQNFEERTPLELLEWAYSVFGERVAALSAMQKAGSVICHMMSTAPHKSTVLFVDTGVNFQETLQTRDRIMQEYGLKVRTLYPEQTMEEQTAKRGILYLSVEGQKECCGLRKVVPLRKIKGEYDAMISSLRRSEGGKRGGVPILTLDTEMNCLRINPLAKMSDEEMDEYIEQNNVIVNPLHDQGFTTIGCNRCTTPVMVGEPPRAGRWRHLGPWAMYCSINPTDMDQAKDPSIELPQSLINRVLGIETDFAI
jgi:phosphoadenosine phosphosulfate reductase